MQDDNRPNPEDLLKLAQAEEEEKTPSVSKRGKFKLFLGFCAGVGKTYRMLQEANACKQNGIDVVVGIVETHGRVETQELISELEIIPEKKLLITNCLLKKWTWMQSLSETQNLLSLMNLRIQMFQLQGIISVIRMLKNF